MRVTIQRGSNKRLQNNPNSKSGALHNDRSLLYGGGDGTILKNRMELWI